jgi:hypothetical protein
LLKVKAHKILKALKALIELANTANSVRDIKISTLCVIVTLYRPPRHQDLGRAGTAGSRFARDDKELGPQLGVTITRRTAT